MLLTVDGSVKNCVKGNRYFTATPAAITILAANNVTAGVVPHVNFFLSYFLFEQLRLCNE